MRLNLKGWFIGKLAASFDGLTWTRFSRNPVLSDGADEREPSAVFFGGAYTLFFVEARAGGEAGIRAAQAIDGTPTDSR